MRKLFLGALLAALCTVPGTSRAATPATRGDTAATSAPYLLARPAADDDSRKSDDAHRYAAREKAAPQLAAFAGGDNGIYIGAGALAIVLAIVVLLAVL